MRRLFAALILCLGMIAMTEPADAQTAGVEQRTPSGLRYTDEKLGTGAEAMRGHTVAVHYTGWLFQNGQKGNKFDSSRDRGEPIEFPLGAGRVVRGWDEGIAGMKVGGRRTLIIPPDLGYGARGAGGGVIPPNATMIFDVELVRVR